MHEKLMPSLFVNHLPDIPLKDLWEQGKKGLILDLDNTVTEWNSMVVREDVASWVRQAVTMGFKVCLLSNNRFPKSSRRR
jgi:predicted HAD superfamily phosphohydrolase YqeG